MSVHNQHHPDILWFRPRLTRRSREPLPLAQAQARRRIVRPVLIADAINIVRCGRHVSYFTPDRSLPPQLTHLFPRLIPGIPSRSPKRPFVGGRAYLSPEPPFLSRRPDPTPAHIPGVPSVAVLVSGGGYSHIRSGTFITGPWRTRPYLLGKRLEVVRPAAD